MNTYIGHTTQLSGVQAYRLEGGKADGMRMLRVRNGKGLDFDISLDRCADITQLFADGINMSYISPCGYVHPAYYQSKGKDFLKSFTAGFCTTCGLTTVGNPCIDDGEELGLHGNISNTPCENYSFEETEKNIIIKAQIRDASLFSNQLLLKRVYTVSKEKNEITLNDTIENIGSKKSPMMILYHCNMGYPLLSENARVVIPSNNVTARSEHAQNDIQNCLRMEKPQPDYIERCYFYDVKDKDGIAVCGIYNPDIEKGMVMSFDKNSLGCFTEWKMMGDYEYVLGFEPGNCNPDRRDVHRRNNTLKFINPGEEYSTKITFGFTDNEKDFEEDVNAASV